jgi:hypothetical protein
MPPGLYPHVVLVPFLVILLAIVTGAAFGYGTDPAWGAREGGLAIIVLARRFQWLLAGASLAACVALIGMVASGRHRAWWLIGLGPVLALFWHRLSGGTLAHMSVADNPPMVSADQAAFLKDDDWVVGLIFHGKAYAFPYDALYNTPAVVCADREQRFLLMWSAFANRAVAVRIQHEIKARELEIASMPANALLLHNARRGQFINGFTGLTHTGEAPAGLGAAIPTWKQPWGQWRKAYPQSLVLALPDELMRRRVPCQPLEMQFSLPARATSAPSEDPRQRVLLLATTRPAALPMSVAQRQAANFRTSRAHVLVVRDATTGRVFAFNRELAEDQPAVFTLNRDRTRKGWLVDSVHRHTWNLESGHGDWPVALRAVENVDRRPVAPPCVLVPLPIDTDLPMGVVRTWFGDVEVIDAASDGEGSGPRPWRDRTWR